MKKSINLWAFTPQTTLENCLDIAKEAGFEGVELVVEEGRVNPKETEERLKEIRREAEKRSLEISSLATGLFWKFNLVSDNPKLREEAENLIRDMLRMSSLLGADTILVVPGAVHILWETQSEIIPYEVAYKRAYQSIEKLVSEAERYKVNIGIENVWNKLFLSPMEMKEFIDDIGSPYLGVYFDVGNVLTIGFPEQWIRILGKRIKKVHLKDFRTAVGNLEGFVGLLEGDVNWPEVMKALKEIGYDDFLVAEVFPYKYHPEALIYNTSTSMDFIMGRR